MLSKPSSLDPKYDGLSPEERIRQSERDKMIWEQTEQIKQQNKLTEEYTEAIRQKIQEERENAEIIAEATKNAEIDRQKYEMRMHKKQQEHDKEKRYNQLCDELGVVYEDLEEFAAWINSLTGKQRDYYDGIIKQYNSLIYTDDIKKLEEDLNKHNNELKEIENNEYDNVLKVQGVRKNGIEYEATLDEIRDEIEKNKPILETVKNTARTVALLTIVCFVAALFIYSSIAIWVLGIGVVLFLFYIDRMLKMKNAIQIMNKLVIENDAKRESLENQIKKEKNKLNKLKDKRIKEIESNANNKDLLDKYYDAKVILAGETDRPNKIEFNEFRYNHYNKDIEMLFRKLNLNIDRIDTEKVKGTGTIEDYVDYINNRLGANSNDDTDYLLFDAIEKVVDKTEISNDFLVDSLKISYKRADRIMEQLEGIGIVSSEKNECRKVLVSRERWESLKSSIEN